MIVLRQSLRGDHIAGVTVIDGFTIVSARIDLEVNYHPHPWSRDVVRFDFAGHRNLALAKLSKLTGVEDEEKELAWAQPKMY
jgi:hypothetical protein